MPGDQLVEHPSLGFVNVAIGAEGTQVLQSLSKLKKLHGINLRVLPSADPDFCSALSKLNGVRWINWSSGRFGPLEAECVAGMQSLKSLVLQSGVELPADFAVGLKKLVYLDRLVIHTPNINYKPKELPPILTSLPNLKHWPQIENLDSEGLTQIAKRTDIQSLEIRHLDPDVDPEEVKAFLSRQKLERLFLYDRKMHGLDFLRGQDKLEMLRIQITLHGDQLSVLSSLPKLKELQVNVGGATGLSFAGIADCQNLEELEITGELVVPRDFELLAGSRSLRRLSIRNGFVDDTVLDCLCNLSTLRDISLGQDSILTDAGIRRLATRKDLERLDVGGFITESGAAELASLPRLQSLILRSSLLGSAQQESIADQLKHVPTVAFHPFRPSRGPWMKGEDGFLRVADEESRRGPGQLEGQLAPLIRGAAVAEAGRFVDLRAIKGKVVVIDFWGVWCGPCIGMMPLLSHLHEKYGDQGLVVLGVHSQQGAHRVEQFLRANPKAWASVVDSDKSFEEAYHVERFPTLYIVDKTGRIRVAQPHMVGLEDAVKRLLVE